MQPLFSPQGEQRLASLLRHRPLLALDFDGTLAPLVDKPEQACAAPAVTRLLEEIGRHLPIAVISGRCLADLRARLDFQPRHLIGEHGAVQEELPAPPVPPALQALRARLGAHADELTRLGVQCEDKPHSLSLHYRTAHDPELAQGALQQLLDGLDAGLRIQRGKMVLSVVDRQAADKGMALRQLMTRHRYRHALYVGDDENDEAAFAALGAEDLGLRIGDDKPDSRAMFCLSDQSGIAAFLARLLQLLSA